MGSISPSILRSLYVDEGVLHRDVGGIQTNCGCWSRFDDYKLTIKKFCKIIKKIVDNCSCILYIITNKNHYQ